MNLKLNEILKWDNNNFGLVRLIAALAVLFGHSFDLFDDNGYTEPVRHLLKFDYSGSLAVYVFFFLSGIFITASFVRSKTFVRFLLMRMFRIWSALIVCNIITVFVIGPLFSLYPLSQYFGSPITWTYLFTNSTIWGEIAYNLPGVFNKNNYANTVNGSLWTLPMEVKCYCLVFFAGCAQLFKSSYYLAILFVVFVALYLTNPVYFLKYIPEALAWKPVVFFIAGSIAYNLKNYIVIDYKIALILVVSCLLLHHTGLFILVFYITLCYCVLIIGASALFKKINLPGDYSYGIYIYAFLTQQMVASLYPEITSYVSLLITVPVTCLLAILSWHFIEAPANKLARNFAGKYELWRS